MDMTTYKTTATWRGGHLGELVCGNGARMDFSAPEALYGKANVLTPEDAFVGSLNMCFQLMFIWVVEKMRIDMVSYKCEAEGFVEELLDQTSVFKKMVLRPKIAVRNCTEKVVKRALALAEKYSLIARSMKAELVIEPEITVLSA